MKKLISAVGVVSLSFVLMGASVFANEQTPTEPTTPVAIGDLEGKKETTTEETSEESAVQEIVAAPDTEGKKPTTVETTVATDLQTTPGTSSLQVGRAVLSLIVTGGAAAVVIKRRSK